MSVVVIGGSANVGRTTLAKQVAGALNLGPVVHIDNLFADVVHAHGQQSCAT